MSLTIWTNFDFIRNLTLRGTGKLETVVWCTKGGFFFPNIDGLIVENITFSHCGTDVGLPPPVPEHPEYVQIAALWFVNVTNLLISQVILRNSTGYAIIGLELGNVSIVGSMFIHNGGQTGGNVYLAISQSTMEKCVQNTSITVTIQGCMFAHGTGTFLF